MRSRAVAMISFLLGCLLASLFAILFLRWSVGGSTSITIENRSGVPLRQVSVSGSGFEASVYEIKPNAEVRLRVYPSGESALRVAFTAGGHRVSHPIDTYLESGYRVRVFVDADLKPTVEVADPFSAWNLILP